MSDDEVQSRREPLILRPSRMLRSTFWRPFLTMFALGSAAAIVGTVVAAIFGW